MIEEEYPLQQANPRLQNWIRKFRLLFFTGLDRS